MKNGKKSLIETKILNIITFINFKLKKQFFFLFFECIEIIKPIMGINLSRFKKKEYRVPCSIKFLKQYKVAIHWLVLNINIKQKVTNFELIFFLELMNIFFFKESSVFIKRFSLYNMVNDNRRFMRFK
jgi:ribosomal protein S7